MALIRRGRRLADYLRADCFAVSVVPAPGLAGLPDEQRESLERHLDFARKLHIETRILNADDSAEALVGFAHTNAITQIFLAKPEPARLLRPDGKHRLVMKVIWLARDIQVTVIANRRGAT